MLLAACAASAKAAGEVEPADRAALDAAVAATCDKSVVLLGEASHGDGHGDAMKVALVERLVSQCGFNGVLFESSFYEFIPIARRERAREPVAPQLVADAVGGLWKFDREVQPLFEFLAARASAGTLEIGGLDFQAGGLQQPYGNDRLFDELAARLAPERRRFCGAVWHSRLYDDTAPDGLSDAARDDALKTCLSEIDTNDSVQQADQRWALANLQAWLANDGRPARELVRSRDRMMADNARRFVERLPAPAKVVVWTHNGHAARSTSAQAGYGNADNLGAALGRRYGDRLFSLATTACGGEYRWSWGSNKPVPPPPDDSLEASVCKAARPASAFIDAAALARAGVTSAGVLGHAPTRARWADAFDGVLVLDAEHPPHGTR